GWLFVHCGSEARADDITAFLREALGELPIVPLGSLCQPEAVWGHWLSSGELPPDTEIKDEMTLFQPAEDATVKVKQLPWDSAEVQQLLDAGYRPNQILLTWDERITVQLNDKSVFKRLKFSDELQEQAANEGGDSAVAEWEAGLHLMTGALRAFTDQYFGWCAQDRPDLPPAEPKAEKS
ncbi:MAG: recombination-associated protein RdgC, partial [Natronospirillum sp.]